MKTPITINKLADGRYEANNGEIYWTDSTPFLAVLGLSVYESVDALLPYDTAYWSEDERYGHWQTISQSVMDNIRPTTEAIA